MHWFCHTLTWIHHGCTRVPPSWTSLPPPSPFHPSGSSQCTSPKHPVSCIETGLSIHFTCDNLHVSMPFSHIIPPLPSPTESKRLFYTSVSLLLSHINLEPLFKNWFVIFQFFLMILWIELLVSFLVCF